MSGGTKAGAIIATHLMHYLLTHHGSQPSPRHSRTIRDRHVPIAVAHIQITFLVIPPHTHSARDNFVSTLVRSTCLVEFDETNLVYRKVP